MRSILASIFSRLCAWRDLVAWARKRFDERRDLGDAPRLARLQRLLQRQILGALLLELRVIAA